MLCYCTLPVLGGLPVHFLPHSSLYVVISFLLSSETVMFNSHAKVLLHWQGHPSRFGILCEFGGGFGQFGDTIRESFRIYCETARLFGLAFE